MDILIQELIDLVKATAPEVWRIATLQVHSLIAQTLFAVVVCIVLIVILAKIIKRLDDEFDSILPWMGLVAVAIALMVLIPCLMGYIINPEYHAIRALMYLVK